VKELAEAAVDGVGCLDALLFAQILKPVVQLQLGGGEPPICVCHR
jgi:hypothetical protein